MSAIDTEPFPRGALIAAAALVGLSLVATAAVRITRLNAPPAAIAAAAPQATLEFNVVDEAGGAVSLREHGAGRLVFVLQPGSDGFVRSVLRGLARERRSHDLGAGPPFRITQWRDGRLLLEDLATGRRIDLDAFGPSNREAFARILRSQGGAG